MTMTNGIARTARWYARQTYGVAAWRRLGTALVAVPLALRKVASRRFARGLLALPVAAAATGLTALLAGLVLINVLAYPFRPYLGLPGNDGGGIWASTYHASWGGPTLAGAWTVHGLGVMLLAFPLLAWTVRGLQRVETWLTGTATAQTRTATARAPRWRPGWYRAGVTATAVGLFFAFARIAHAAGIGDNVLWLPRDLRSGLALAVVLMPLAAAALTARTWWRFGAAYH
jgi:hypothetical protein